MTSGEKIRRARRNAGLTQKELGKKLGMTQQQIAQYENGGRQAKFSTLNKIGYVLNISPYQLGDDYEFRDVVDPPRMKVVTKAAMFRSDKGTRLSCKIDSTLYDNLAIFADQNKRTLEDEVEDRLYWSVENDIEDICNQENAKEEQSIQKTEKDESESED